MVFSMALPIPLTQIYLTLRYSPRWYFLWDTLDLSNFSSFLLIRLTAAINGVEDFTKNSVSCCTFSTKPVLGLCLICRFGVVLAMSKLKNRERGFWKLQLARKPVMNTSRKRGHYRCQSFEDALPKRTQTTRIHSEIHIKTVELMMNAQRHLKEYPQPDSDAPKEDSPPSSYEQKPFWPALNRVKS